MSDWHPTEAYERDGESIFLTGNEWRRTETAKTGSAGRFCRVTKYRSLRSALKGDSIMSNTWIPLKAWIDEERHTPFYAFEIAPGAIYRHDEGWLTAEPTGVRSTQAWVKNGRFIIRTKNDAYLRLDDNPATICNTLAEAQGLDDLTDISDDALVAELRRRGRLRRVRATQEIDHYYLDQARFDARPAIKRQVRQMLAEEIPAHETSERGKDRTTFSAELEVLL